MPELARIGVWGAGNMGAGIARAFATAGFETLMIDAEPDRATYARSAILDAVARRDPAAAQAIAGRLQALRTPEVMRACDLLVEAVYEDLDVKRGAYEAMGRIRYKGLIATNTSSLSIASLARDVAAPGRFLGMHFFVPAHANPLVEVVRGPKTSAAAVRDAVKLCAALGKTPLVCADTPGFVTNRFYLPFCNEAMRMAGEGLASAAVIDAAACKAFRLSIGPFAVCRLGRLSTTLASIAGLAPLGSFFEPAVELRRRARDELQWPEDALAPDAHISPALVSRLRGAVFLSILQALDDEVASADAFDTAARVGLRFGAPPCALMDELGKSAVYHAIAPLITRHGMKLPRSLERVGALTASAAAGA